MVAAPLACIVGLRLLRWVRRVTATDESLAYTVEKAAEIAGVSPMTIRRAYASGALEVHYPTSRPVILRADLESWLRRSPTLAG